MSNKTIVILAGRKESTNIVYNALKDNFRIERVILEDPVSRTRFLKRRAKNLGLTVVVGQILFQLLVVPFLKRSSRKRRREIMDQLGLDNSPIDEAKVSNFPSVNSDETIALLKKINPDAVVVNGTRIIAKRILTCIPAKFINVHAGITPLYRGVHGGYWALVEGKRDACGVTVHLVDPGIDTGNIIAQERIEVTPEDNFVTYPLLQLAKGIHLLEKTIHDVFEGRLDVKPPPEGTSNLWSHPTIFEYFRHRLRRGVK